MHPITEYEYFFFGVLVFSIPIVYLKCLIQLSNHFQFLQNSFICLKHPTNIYILKFHRLRFLQNSYIAC